MLETDPSTSGKRTVRAPLAGQPRETLPCFGGNDTVPEGENGAQPRSSTPKAASANYVAKRLHRMKGE